VKFKPSTVDDIRRYYEGSYCKVPEFGDKLFLLKQVVAASEGVEIRLKDSQDDLYTILLEEEAPYEMNFALPHRAIFNYRDTVYLLERVPARQYKRGITSENTHIIEVFSGKPQGLSFARLEAFVTKSSYCSVNEVLFGKRRGTVAGLALSPRLSFHTPSQTFYMDCVPFAKYLREQNLLVPVADKAYKLFVSELKKLVDSNHPTQPLFS